MAATYKAVEISEPGTFRLVERPVVAPGAGQVRLRVEACGVCHSDAANVDAQFPDITYPRVPGHEVIGHIEEVGLGVKTWKVGHVLESDSSEVKTEPAKPVAAASRPTAKIPS